MISTNNTIAYCNYGATGVFYLSEVLSFTDSSSTYYNNSGADGGIYHIIGSLTNQAIISIKNSNYNYNYGYTGGLTTLVDNFKATISGCNFNYNSANKGAVIYSTQVSPVGSSAANSSLLVSNCYFNNNTAASQGGAVWFSHTLLNA